jgi:hypothetical protein
MNQTQKKIDLIAEAIYISLLGLGALAGTFFAPTFLQKPLLAWTALFIVCLLRLFKGNIPEKALNLIRAFAYGVSVLAIIVLFTLSTNGQTGFFGSIPESDYSKFTYWLGMLAVTYFLVIALFEFALGLIGKKREIKYTKTTTIFYILAIAAFALLIININGILPWLKSFDMYLFLGSVVFVKIAFTLPRAK